MTNRAPVPRLLLLEARIFRALEPFGREVFEHGQAFSDHLHCVAVHHLIIPISFVENVVQSVFDRIEGIEKILRPTERTTGIISKDEVFFHPLRNNGYGKRKPSVFFPFSCQCFSYKTDRSGLAPYDFPTA